jgi:hypothetical protein
LPVCRPQVGPNLIVNGYDTNRAGGTAVDAVNTW